ncbi:hypothetical protein XELAEV_18028207mg [Xenopus laevis]|uniref:Uncharacterized protein n=1 Tax=Xenopus laevis TaxID=8355 RepID=A0A974CZ92_XENLA|nr:hypothetical protein XELAEV_18028207mg [Xenopus laevis]
MIILDGTCTRFALNADTIMSVMTNYLEHGNPTDQVVFLLAKHNATLIDFWYITIQLGPPNLCPNFPRKTTYTVLFSSNVFLVT